MRKTATVVRLQVRTDIVQVEGTGPALQQAWQMASSHVAEGFDWLPGQKPGGGRLDGVVRKLGLGPLGGAGESARE